MDGQQPANAPPRWQAAWQADPSPLELSRSARKPPHDPSTFDTTPFDLGPARLEEIRAAGGGRSPCLRHPDRNPSRPATDSFSRSLQGTDSPRLVMNNQGSPGSPGPD